MSEELILLSQTIQSPQPPITSGYGNLNITQSRVDGFSYIDPNFTYRAGKSALQLSYPAQSQRAKTYVYREYIQFPTTPTEGTTFIEASILYRYDSGSRSGQIASDLPYPHFAIGFTRPGFQWSYGVYPTPSLIGVIGQNGVPSGGTATINLGLRYYYSSGYSSTYSTAFTISTSKVYLVNFRLTYSTQLYIEMIDISTNSIVGSLNFTLPVSFSSNFTTIYIPFFTIDNYPTSGISRTFTIDYFRVRRLV